MRGKVPVICPSSQVKLPATQWHDGQITLLAAKCCQGFSVIPGRIKDASAESISP
jgi:hypothetical protein